MIREELDEALARVMQSARFEDRTVNMEQFQVLQEVCKTIADMVGGAAVIGLHPAFSGGCVTARVTGVRLDEDEVRALRSVLEKCSVFAVDTFVNGDIEIGVTVPNVFEPLSDN